MTADILIELVKDKKVTYESIRVVDPERFADLEPTMRMLYDHQDDDGS